METVQESPAVDNLGLIFDRHLTWDAHISDLVRRCIGLLIGLRHPRHYLPWGVLRTVVDGLVLSRVRYCVSVYGGGTSKNDARLLKIVNFATRVITGLGKNDRIAQVREDLGPMSHLQMYEVSIMTVSHKAITNGEPLGISTQITIFRDLLL